MFLGFYIRRISASPFNLCLSFWNTERIAPHDLSRSPVVDRTNTQGLLEMVRRWDLFKAYQIALIRRPQPI